MASASASTASAAASVPAPAAGAAPLELWQSQAPRNMEQHFADMAAYVKVCAREIDEQRQRRQWTLSDPDDPPVWPRSVTPVPPCVFDSSTVEADVYGQGGHLAHFEAHLANLFGKEAGSFMVTGVAAQLAAIKIHSSGMNAIFAAHPKCHLILHESRAFEAVWGMSCLQVGPASRSMTCADVEAAFARHWKIPSVLVVELPDRELGGVCIGWDELVRIREYTRSKGVRMHLDGARVWEAQAYYNRGFQEIASMFDSVYVSFYKGLGSVTGAMLLGSSEFIAEARVWQHRLGGRMYNAFPLSLPAERALNAHVNSFASRRAKLIEVVAAITLAEAEFVRTHDGPTTTLGKMRAAAIEAARKKAAAEGAAKSPVAAAEEGADSSAVVAVAAAVDPAAVTAAVPFTAPAFHPFFRFQPPVPHVSMVHMYLSLSTADAVALRDDVRAATGLTLFSRVRGEAKHSCVWEWNMGEANSAIDTAQFVRGWSEFIAKRHAQLQAQMEAQ